MNEATITPDGRSVTAALQGARERMAGPILAKWTEKDLRAIVRLMRRFVDDLIALPDETHER